MKQSNDEKLEQYIQTGHSEIENHARTQQKIFEDLLAKEPSFTRLISEFIKTNLLKFAWHYLKSRFGKRFPYPSYPTRGDTGIYPLQSATQSKKITIGLLSDWATDTIESDRVAWLTASYQPDYTVHMGDIYFVGTPKEIYENFTAPHASWYYGTSGSLALSGNHEMYSNGRAFFEELLPRMYAMNGSLKYTQKAGFFCLENEYWRVIGLDTGYTSVGKPFLEIISPPNGHLRKEQIDWLTNVVRLGNPDDRRGLVFLSHHPYISPFRGAFQVPADQLREILGEANRPVIWFWGHEHRLISYRFQQQKDGPLAYGRCIGHGGMPVDIDIPYMESSPEEIQYYDTRIRKEIGRHRIGYNGMVLLSLNHTELTAEYRDLDNTLVMHEMWTLNQNYELEWELLDVLPELRK